MLMAAFFEQDGATIRKLIDRFKKMPASLSDFAFMRFAEFARDTLEGRPGVVDTSQDKVPIIPTTCFRIGAGGTPRQ
jgi:hypothetical protein